MQSTTYDERKERAREAARDWQQSFDQQDYSWHDLQVAEIYLTKLAKRYGLTDEFKTEGII